jgi:galactonate dehydratase
LPSYLKEWIDLRHGKIYPNDRPGLGIVFDEGSTHLIDEITQSRNISGYRRPDGSFTTL